MKLIEKVGTGVANPRGLTFDERLPYMTVEQRVREMFMSMRVRPRMWASTRESLQGQVIVLLTALGAKRDFPTRPVVVMTGMRGPSLIRPDDPPEEEFARELLDEALQVLDTLPKPREPKPREPMGTVIDSNQLEAAEEADAKRTGDWTPGDIIP